MNTYNPNEDNQALFEEMEANMKAIAGLICKSWAEALTAKEKDKIETWISRGEGRQELVEKYSNPKNALKEGLLMYHIDERKMFDDLLAQNPEEKQRMLRNLDIKKQFIEMLANNPAIQQQFTNTIGFDE